MTTIALEFMVPATVEVDLETGEVVHVSCWDTESGPYVGAYDRDTFRKPKGGQVRRAIEAADNGQMWPSWSWG